MDEDMKMRLWRKLIKISFIATAICWFFALCLAITSCTPPYPPCDASQASNFRCNGTMVEMCAGEQWHPREDCAEQWNPEGELTPLECVESGDSADCE